MSLDHQLMAMIEGWYEEFLEEGCSEEEAANKAQEKFEEQG